MSDDGERYYRLYTTFSPLEEQGQNIAAELERACALAGVSWLGARVLDLGCGQGQVVRELRRRGCEAFGIERSEWALANLMPEAKAYIVSGDATELGNFAAAAFDLLIANLTPHIEPERMVEFLRGCARVARLGTLVRYITPSWIDQLERDLGADGPEARRLYAPWTREHAWWRETFAKAGLRELSRITEETWDTWVLLAAEP